MGLIETLNEEIAAIIKQPWDVRDGNVVPTTEDVKLAGGAVKLDATFLYSDLADSTALAMWDRRVAARISKAFLACTTRLIRAHDGQIRSFDGDRVMGVFIGNRKNSNAAKCGLQINWMFGNVLKPKFEAQYPKIKDGTYKLAYCTGVDTSEVLVVRSGIRDNNDLVWVGQAPNIAAKLSNFRNSPHHTYITGAVYGKLSDESKLSQGQNMWKEWTWTVGPVRQIFSSSYWWRPI